MQRYQKAFTATAAITAGLFIVSARSAMSSGQTGGLVRLQSTSPGTAQTGNLNISGIANIGGIKMATGAADGRYLRSDATGAASWETFPTTFTPGGAAGGDLAGAYPNPTLKLDPNSLAKVSGGAMTTNGTFVGIGTSTPIGSAGFVLNQPLNGFGGMYINSGTLGRPFYGYSLSGGVAGYHYIDGSDNNKWKLVNGPNVQMTIQTDGKVGFGTTTPRTKLEVLGLINDDILRVTRSTPSGSTLSYDSSVLGDSGTDFTIGVTGLNTGYYGVGVYGGADGTGAIGVYGYTAGTDVSSSGLYSYATGNAFAGTFSGKVQVLGNLSKGGGSFKIDHPLDPANKYLYHSFVESPEMMNIYNGTVTTDNEGFATVTMPTYFEALNRDFRYQLTVVGEGGGSWTMARIYRKIKGNSFVIQTSNPNVEVSWMVTGVRHDDFANANRIQVEVEKEPINKGKYLYPREAGLPEDMGIAYRSLTKNTRKK